MVSTRAHLCVRVCLCGQAAGADACCLHSIAMLERVEAKQVYLETPSGDTKPWFTDAAKLRDDPTGPNVSVALRGVA